MRQQLHVNRAWAMVSVMGLALATLADPGCVPDTAVSPPAPPPSTGVSGTTGTTTGTMPPPDTGIAGTVGTTGGAGTTGTSGAGARGAVSGSTGTGSLTCNNGGAGSASMSMPTRARGILFPPQVGSTVTAPVAPPSVSGGTLRVLADGVTAVAADPDRDRVYVVDLASRAVRWTVMLEAGSEPGRVIEDASGRVHVALRHGGALATIDPGTGAYLWRREVCAAPRGVTYDRGMDLVHVACADGELVSLPAANGAAVRTLKLDRDLRDVVVAGSRLMVSRFRSAELLAVEASGAVSARIVPPAFSSTRVRASQLFTPGVAWQMTAQSDGAVVMLHQRGVVDPVMPVQGGYGGTNPCDAIVHPAITVVAADGSMKSGPALAGLVLAVDMALSPDGQKVAVISAGNATNQQPTSTGPQLTRVFVTDLSAVVDGVVGCKPDGKNGPCLPPMTTVASTDGQASITGCPANPQVVGQPIAVAFAGDGSVVVQSREPAMLAMPDGNNISLATDSRNDTGHLVFHANAGGFVACASCHVEGDDDGRVWNFDCSAAGARRTQSLQTGVRDSEPFHWAGDEANMTLLMKDVFVTRMSGPSLANDQVDALVTWIDAQPRRPHARPADGAAVERGRVLFNDTNGAACASCHAGARLSNNTSVDVGTGRAFQVPSLLGVGTRGPFMHNGCAQTLRDRFRPECGGGDAHGVTSKLGEAQISDLIAYLDSL